MLLTINKILAILFLLLYRVASPDLARECFEILI